MVWGDNSLNIDCNVYHMDQLFHPQKTMDMITYARSNLGRCVSIKESRNTFNTQYEKMVEGLNQPWTWAQESTDTRKAHDYMALTFVKCLITYVLILGSSSRIRNWTCSFVSYTDNWNVMWIPGMILLPIKLSVHLENISSHLKQHSGYQTDTT